MSSGSSSADDGPCSLAPLPTTSYPPCKKGVGFLSVLPRKREVVRQFTPSWFTVTMGTGSVAITIGSFPYHFPGQMEVAWALWWLTAVLFALFSLLFLGRAVFFSSTMPKLFQHPNQSLFMGAVPMSFSTITNGVCMFWVPRYGATASAAAHAMYWVNLPGVLGCILLVPWCMFTMHKHGLHSMTAVWLLPVVPACVAANTAGVVAAKMSSPDDAVVLIYLGVCLLGIGFLLSYQVCTIYYQRLLFHSLPAKEVIVSSFLPVGPMGMTAWALLNLSAAAGHQLVEYIRLQPEMGVDVTWLQDSIMPMWVAASGAAAMFLWGFATWWLLLAFTSISSTLAQGIPFNLGWWGCVFPMGVYTGATIQMGRVVHSLTFKILGSLAVCVHVLMWLVVVGLTAYKAWSGQLFHAPCLAQPDRFLHTPCAEVARIEEALSQRVSSCDVDPFHHAATGAAGGGSGCVSGH